jgi:hypothetical protein
MSSAYLSLLTFNNTKRYVRRLVTCLKHTGASLREAGADLGCVRACVTYYVTVELFYQTISLLFTPSSRAFWSTQLRQSRREREGTMSKDSIKHTSSVRTTLRWRDVPDDMVETHIKDLLYAERNIKTM